MPTTPTQIRLTDDDLAKIVAIQELAGLPSLAATVRFCVGRVHRSAFGDAPKKSRKKPKTALDSVATGDILPS